MPQLDTVYIFLIFLWGWLLLNLMMQKIKNLSLTNLTTHQTPNKPTVTSPWL